MTDYFEVHARDSAARRGELRLAESVPTPALVGDVLEDAASSPSGTSRSSCQRLPASARTSPTSAGVGTDSASRSSPRRAAESRAWTSK